MNIEGIVAPTVHLNGTSKQSLVEALEIAVQAIRHAEETLSDTAPNARDYYVHPACGAFHDARTQHGRRADDLRRIRLELMAVWESIENQGAR